MPITIATGKGTFEVVRMSAAPIMANTLHGRGVFSGWSLTTYDQ